MLIYPKLKDCYRLEILDEETCFLLWEKGNRLLKGRLFGLVLPLADGSRTTEEIVDLLEDQAPLAQIYYTLMLLQQSDFLVEYDPQMPLEVAAFWQAEGIDTAVLRQTLQRRGVKVVPLISRDPAPFQKALADLGIVERAVNLVVYLVDDFLEPDLAEINRQALISGMPWALVKPLGTVTWVGPVFQPGESGCWQCLATRLEDNRQIETFVQHYKAMPHPVNVNIAALPATIDACYQLAALELARWLVGASDPALQPRLGNKLLTIDWQKMDAQEHTFVKRLQCPACGE